MSPHGRRPLRPLLAAALVAAAALPFVPPHAGALPTPSLPEAPDLLAPLAMAQAERVLVGPDSRLVIVVGAGGLESGKPAIVVTGLLASTGEVVWRNAWSHPSIGPTWLMDAAISPDGLRVYAVAYHSEGSFALVAFHAHSGAFLWLASGDVPGYDRPAAFAVEASPDGRMVAVAGAGWSAGASEPRPLVAGYDALTGSLLWATEPFPAELSGFASAIAFTREMRMTVAAVTESGGSARAPRAVSLDPGTGAVLWSTALPGPGPQLIAGAHGSADGARFVIYARDAVGRAWGLDAATGHVRWSRVVEVGGNLFDPVFAASDDDTIVYLGGTGLASESSTLAGIVVAVDASTGAEAWRRSIAHEGFETTAPKAIAADRNGRVSVASVGLADGASAFVVDSLSGTSGAREWTATFDATREDSPEEHPRAIALANGRVVTAGVGADSGSTRAELATFAEDDGALLWSHPGSAPEPFPSPPPLPPLPVG